MNPSTVTAVSPREGYRSLEPNKCHSFAIEYSELNSVCVVSMGSKFPVKGSRARIKAEIG